MWLTSVVHALLVERATVSELASLLGRVTEHQGGSGYRFATPEPAFPSAWLAVTRDDNGERVKYVELRVSSERNLRVAELAQQFGR